MIFILAFAAGVVLLFFAAGVFSMSLWSDEGRGWSYAITAVLLIPALGLIGWSLAQIIMLAP